MPLRWLASYHAVLVLYVEGTIPAAFAITAGCGDIAVASTALIVILAALPVTSRRRW